MYIYRLLLIATAFASSANYVLTLECYSCYGTGASNRCEKYDTYKKAWIEGQTNPLFKICKAPFNHICYIETYYEKGNVVSQIRDCGDGVSFTFTRTKDKSIYYDRLRRTEWNNEPVCVFDHQYMVCLSMCTDNYCNGPERLYLSNPWYSLAMLLIAITVYVLYENRFFL